ncbi:DUF4041 domain-containing protein [Bacillus sp. ISL-4]|uniref:DUF4041 domain-containing protein n=1 Tax=Bacillus sp. ISL-4 TaxID=2819125 RepID=UPI001BE8EEC9|nr:DUF4041 domain-containing protein [Bacillus sp. ISL-4]MBT2668648.1 DUF4041 domain-containing protein [Bacillus sp. ISL-4]MBT2673378.1 DUF4041 domain-containing protein [Streptomyces sp. ISL-14]
MGKNSWYLSMWFIAIMFALWFLILPIIIGIILLVRINKETKNTHKKLNENMERIHHLENALGERELEIERLILQKQKDKGLIHLTQTIKMVSKIKEKEDALFLWEDALIKKEQEIRAKITQETALLNLIAKGKEEDNNREHELEEIKRQIRILENKRINLEDEVLLQSFGFYDNKFFLENSQEYLTYLAMVRSKQKQLVREKRATKYDMISLEEENIVPNVVSESAQSKQQIKLAIRFFNNECDAVISKVKFNNVEVSEKKIRSSFYDINKLNKYNSISIREEYLHLKLEELFLVHEYAEKKQEEREEQRRINELIREEIKVQKELEEELNIIKKEEQHLLNVISQLSSQVSEQEMLQYKNRLEEIREQKEKVDYRVKNTRAGYVYVISNIGCFGENVYKIGMTRRLEPMDRVRELGGASVPFHFDVHAMIFSEDAPALEASLHRAFHHRRVNRINERKEFFRVTLNEIKKIVHQNHNAFIEFTMISEAKEYRETQILEKQLTKQHII